VTFKIALVDDDAGVQKAICRLLRAAGYEARAYTTAGDFLADTAAAPCCIILDLHLPGIDGLELQERLALAGGGRPIIFISGTGDVPRSVKAMKAGPTTGPARCPRTGPRAGCHGPSPAGRPRCGGSKAREIDAAGKGGTRLCRRRSIE
jgi:CheY-like chemotaxis protein